MRGRTIFYTVAALTVALGAGGYYFAASRPQVTTAPAIEATAAQPPRPANPARTRVAPAR